MHHHGPADSGQFHAVRFYKHATGLCEIVGKFIADGFQAGEPAIIIVTPEHRTELIRCLETRGIDVEARVHSGQIAMLDAADTLREFMVDGMPDALRFRQTIEPVITAAVRRASAASVRAYGEMVDVLWQAGQTTAAVRIETLWNDLATTSRFSLLCGYAMGNVYKDTDVETICGHHSHVITEDARAVPALATPSH
jgi:hypothetical protein